MRRKLSRSLYDLYRFWCRLANSSLFPIAFTELPSYLRQLSHKCLLPPPSKNASTQMKGSCIRCTCTESVLDGSGGTVLVLSLRIGRQRSDPRHNYSTRALWWRSSTRVWASTLLMACLIHNKSHYHSPIISHTRRCRSFLLIMPPPPYLLAISSSSCLFRHPQFWT